MITCLYSDWQYLQLSNDVTDYSEAVNFSLFILRGTLIFVKVMKIKFETLFCSFTIVMSLLTWSASYKNELINVFLQLQALLYPSGWFLFKKKLFFQNWNFSILIYMISFYFWFHCFIFVPGPWRLQVLKYENPS